MTDFDPTNDPNNENDDSHDRDDDAQSHEPGNDPPKRGIAIREQGQIVSHGRAPSPRNNAIGKRRDPDRQSVRTTSH